MFASAEEVVEKEFDIYPVSAVSFFPGPADLNLMSFLMSSKNFFISLQLSQRHKKKESS